MKINYNNLSDFIPQLGLVAGMAVGAGFTYTVLQDRLIPQETVVQQGYAAPSKLEIKLGDLNQDGKPETILQYDGKSYLLTVDAQGKPAIEAYQIAVKK